jgi:hypothetical protein
MHQTNAKCWNCEIRRNLIMLYVGLDKIQDTWVCYDYDGHINVLMCS